MDKKTYAARRDRLRTVLIENELDALFVSYPANRYYLSGFELHDGQCNESSGQLLITADGTDWLLTDSRYVGTAQKLWDEEHIFIYKAPALETTGKFLAKNCLGKLGVETSALCWQTYETLSQYKTLIPSSGLVEKLRLIKEPAEIDALRRSCALNHKVFEQIIPFIKPGRTEEEMTWEIEKLYREQGASGLAFHTIFAVGPNGALPHAVAGKDKILKNCPILLDMGCRLEDYCSDQTRTFWHGNNPTRNFETALKRTQEAQNAGIDAIKPGESIAKAYLNARKVFEKYSCAKHFTHALGHGIGLETHEGPSLHALNEDEFQPGMVVTVEPGLYYPSWGGTRWEHMVLVTESGCEVFLP